MGKIAVIGAGVMGHGIAELFAMAGYEVNLVDISEDILKRALQNIEASLNKLKEKGIVKEDVRDVLARIRPIVKDVCEAVKDVELMVEAVIEDLEVKRNVFSEADKCAPPNTILATNTSSLPITEIAEAVSPKRRPLVVGMHFFNPPVILKLVEVVRGAYTSDETVRRTVEYAKRLGKEVVIVNKDVPGFIVNRIFMRLANTACWLVEKGVYDVKSIDSALRYRAGLPMGIFVLMDYTGLDVICSILNSMTKRGFKADICPGIRRLCEARKFGVKTGEGFYRYPEPGKFQWPEIPREAGEKVDVNLLLAPTINEAAWLIREGIASKEDIDKAIRLGLNWPKGPLELADEIGLDVIVESLRKLREMTGLEEFEPDKLLVELATSGRLGRKTGEGFYRYVTEEKSLGPVILRLEPPLAWIILNKPEKLNAIDFDMIRGIEQALKEVEGRNDIRVVVFIGRGRAFSAGADIGLFKEAGPFDMFRLSREFQRLFRLIEYYPKPTICAINGIALGGGLELALACDFRIASENAELGQPEIDLGIIPGAGATQRLVRIIGIAKAKEMIMLGRRIDAREAERAGLVNKAVPPERLEEEVRKLALRLAEKPPLALMMAKYAISQAWEPMGEVVEALAFALASSTEDAKEGVKAFFEKRRPTFKGK